MVAYAAVFGLLIGSFLTVVVERVPAGESIVAPGSRCGACGLRLGPLEARGERFVTTTDSEVLTRLIALAPGDNMVLKLRQSMPRLNGAYSLVVLTKDKLFAVRDQEYFPALMAGDRPKAAKALQTIAGLYQAHRQVIGWEQSQA